MIKIFLQKIKFLFIILWAFYLFLNIMLYFNQKEMLYLPDNSKDFFDCQNFTEKEIKQYKSTRFYEVSWIKNNVVLFFHWNAWSACDRTFLLDILKKTNNDIIFVEYSWYWELNNKPNINSILKNVDEIWEYINSNKYDNVYVMWKSIWTGPASYYTKNYNVDKLLLISSYSKLSKIVEFKYSFFPINLLFTENYDSEDYLKEYKNDILIFHWEKDIVIPYEFGLELYNWLKNINKKFISKVDGTHHNLFSFDDVNIEIINYFKN